MSLLGGVLLGALFALWRWLLRVQREIDALRERVARLEGAEPELARRAAPRTVDADWRR